MDYENILTLPFSVDDIENRLYNNSMFRYSITEGGFISNDNSIIIITSRSPYDRKVFAYYKDLSFEEKEYWIKELEKVFK